MRRLAPVLLSVLALSILALAAPSAQAIPPFKKEFETRYVSDGSPLATAVAEAKCNLCHKGTSKKDLNSYGAALEKLLDKATDAKDVPKIQKALETVEQQPADPSNTNSPAFGELIKAGKLPGGKG
jgi:hypothetical protein